MKKKFRESSNIIDARDSKTKQREEAKTKFDQKVARSPRILVNEPVAWNNDKSEADRLTDAIYNPGRNLRGIKKIERDIKDPAPQKFSKNRRRKNYDNIPDFEFFKHDIKDNK